MVLKTVSTLGGGAGGGGGGVSSVGATSPLNSSGGATPNISLTGIVSVPNGGTGLANIPAGNVIIGNGTSALYGIAPGTAGNVLTSIGGVWVSNAAASGGGNGTPGGANTQIQFNNAGAFAGSANLTWDGGNVQIGSSGRIKLSNGVTNYVAFNAPAIIPANVTWTLPSTDGATGNFLITDGSGTLSWGAANLTPIAPSNYALPVVSGNTTVGQTLSSTTGSWNGYPAPTFAYQWVRGASNIANATSATYPLVDLDYNNTIKVIVIASNSAGNATANSVATANIAGTVPGAPTIGTATPGNTQASVSFTANAVTGGPNVTIYTATSNPENITGTNNVSPVIVSGLTNGNSYTFTVTATNIIGTSLPSAASNSVTPTPIVQDTSFGYVPLLLETTSTNGQNNQGTTTTNGFLDSSSNTFTITRNGSPTQGSVTPYWPNGQWSNYFDGTSDWLSSTNATTAFQFGSNAYTVEGWVYQTSRSGTPFICGGQFSGTGFQAYINSSGFVVVSVPGVGDLTASNIAIPLNAWTHFAIVRSSTSAGGFTYYINGAAAGTPTDANNYSGTTTTFNVATTNNSSLYVFNGYISNFRIVKGVAVYTGAFTPPTAPLAATQSAGANIAAITGTATALLTCQSNRFIDRSNQVTPATINPNGTPTVQAFQPFSPAAAYTPAAYAGSGYFDGGSYLSVADNAAFTFNADFTIECWFFCPRTPTANETICSKWAAGSQEYIFEYGVRSGSNARQIRFFWSPFSDAGPFLTSVNDAFNVNQWNHVAVSRSGSSCKMFVNGIEVASGTNSSAGVDRGSDLAICRYSGSAADYLTGYVSNFRMVKGTGVYTGAFTPPTLAPLTTAGSTSAASYSSTLNVNTSFASSATSLLLNFANAGIYDAAAQNVISTVGDAQVSTTEKKWPPTSIKFDGTGDYLTMPTNQALVLGTGDFTIEMWLWTTSYASFIAAIDFRPLGTNGFYPYIYISDTNGTVRFYVDTGDRITGGTAITLSAWNYIALTRASGITRLYLNGVKQGNDYTDTNSYLCGTNRPAIGGSGAILGTGTLNGYIQDLRITKGVARTVTTIPTAPFPVQ